MSYHSAIKSVAEAATAGMRELKKAKLPKAAHAMKKLGAMTTAVASQTPGWLDTFERSFARGTGDTVRTPTKAATKKASGGKTSTRKKTTKKRTTKKKTSTRKKTTKKRTTKKKSSAKRKPTAKQLAALARGRKKAAANRKKKR
jgi:hypothetical protein